MRVLFDNGTPNPIARSLVGHDLKNGDLLQYAEAAGYELLLTSDKNIRYQQNLSGRMIAIVVLGNPQWPDVQLHLDRIVGFFAVSCG